MEGCYFVSTVLADTSTMGKRKRSVYVNRSEVLKHSSAVNQLAILPLVASPLASKFGTFQRHFTHKLEIRESEYSNYLTPYVMLNEICVMFMEECMPDVIEVVFAMESNMMSGKRKKGARNVKIGDTLATFRFSDNSTRDIKSSISGKLLETNLNLISNPKLLSDKTNGNRYLAIIYPDSRLPSADGSVTWESIQADSEANYNVCFDWRAGKCSRGDKCKYKHE